MVKKDTDRNRYKEIERQKTIEKDLDYEFIRINPVLIKKVLMSMLKLVKYTITLKNLLSKISKRLWKLEFKSDHLKNFLNEISN